LLIAPLLAQVVVFPIGERQQAQDPFKETSYSLSTFGWNNKRHGGFIHTYMWGERGRWGWRGLIMRGTFLWVWFGSIYTLVDNYNNKLVFFVQQGVCHTVALPFTNKSIKAKEELWKLKYNFTVQKYT
jgi:hypothetical protein